MDRSYGVKLLKNTNIREKTTTQKEYLIALKLTTMATMKIADANVPIAMYALCIPMVVPFDITAL